MNKTWKDIPGYEGLYQVSDSGNVRSVNRTVKQSRYGTAALKGQLLSPGVNSDGYYTVVLSNKQGKRKSVKVHRLVASAFLEAVEGKTEVCHGDKGKQINAVTNLRYGTRRENMLDMRRDHTHCGKAVIRGDGVRYASQQEAGEAVGCSADNIRKVCKGRNKTAAGHTWRYQ